MTRYAVVYIRPDGTLGKRTFPTRAKASTFAQNKVPGASLILEVRDGKLTVLDTLPAAL